VLSQRGHGGGFRLRRPPAQIPVRDALAALDLDLGTSCAFGFAECDPVRPCALHPLWSRLRETLAQWTEGATFADLAGGAAQSIAGAGRPGACAVPRSSAG
jgi:DNA-binding IscR family transcriptional regulator